MLPAELTQSTESGITGWLETFLVVMFQREMYCLLMLEPVHPRGLGTIVTSSSSTNNLVGGSTLMSQDCPTHPRKGGPTSKPEILQPSTNLEILWLETFSKLNGMTMSQNCTSSCLATRTAPHGYSVGRFKFLLLVISARTQLAGLSLYLN